MKITGKLGDQYQSSVGNFQSIDLKVDFDLRDYFAAKAMQGFAADPNYGAAPVDMAKNAYDWADAMLLERSKNDK